ncbi:MAG: hypothetical protein AAF798_14485 [Bacteroidota bacterium]
MKYLSLLLLCFFSFGSFSGLSAQESSWRLVYENDAKGQAVQGKLEELIAAVRAGQEIRIYWSSYRVSDPAIKVEHVADAKFLTIMSDEIVFAQIDPIIGQTPDFEVQEIKLKENLAWSFIAASNGKTDQMMRNVMTGEILGHATRQRGIKWFVKQ